MVAIASQEFIMAVIRAIIEFNLVIVQDLGLGQLRIGLKVNSDLLGIEVELRIELLIMVDSCLVAYYQKAFMVAFVGHR